VPELSQPAPFPELAVERSGAHPNAVHTPNPLLVYLDERWDEDTESSLISGLKMCGRFDAGLTLLVLFREGIAAASGADAIARVRRLATAVGLAALVQEDVRGRWADALDLRARAGEPAWRLIGPPGAVAWAHDGLVSGDRLGAALDRHLVRCPDASPAVVRAGVSVGDDASLVVTRDFSDLMVAPCPALPLGHAGAGSVLVFVQNDSDSSRTRLRQLSGDFGESAGGPLVVVVVDGANAREAEALRTDLHADAVVLADPSGTMTDRFGITVWPTTIGLDPRGRVTAVATGAEPLRDDRSAAE
jgi:hypothetical protein